MAKITIDPIKKKNSIGFQFSILLTWILLGFFTSCHTNTVFEENIDFSNNVWHVENSPAFEFEIENATNAYHIYLNVRNSINYPFRNLYVKYQIVDSTQTILRTELIELQLFNGKTGKPFGSGLGDIFDHQQLLLENFKFPVNGKYTIIFEQYMRRDELPFLMSIGTKIERVDENNR